jgi:cation:H+ antiporter
LSSLASPLLLAIFVLAAVVTWIAGSSLSKATDALDHRYHLGEDIGGMVLLALAGTLPEIAITVPAAIAGHLDLAAGNLIGGIAVQTMVLVLCDAAVAGKHPLSFLVGSLMPVLEAALVVVVLCGVLMGGLLPAHVAIGPVSPASLAIVVAWLGGIAVLNRVARAPQWQVEMPGSNPGRSRHRRSRKASETPAKPPSGGHPGTVFAIASLITLGAGILLEITGDELASRAGINGVIFGATFLSLASALPEISSGIAAVRLGDHRLAVGDIFGGNAFQVCLFLLADLLANRPVLPAAGRLNSWLAVLGIALTVIYAYGVIIRRERCVFRLGVDSMLALGVFGLGIAGLVAVHA